MAPDDRELPDPCAAPGGAARAAMGGLATVVLGLALFGYLVHRHPAAPPRPAPAVPDEQLSIDWLRPAQPPGIASPLAEAPATIAAGPRPAATRLSAEPPPLAVPPAEAPTATASPLDAPAPPPPPPPAYRPQPAVADPDSPVSSAGRTGG